MTDDQRGSRRWLLPLVGLAVALSIYFLQNVWGVFNVGVIAQTIRGLHPLALLVSVAALGFCEATVILCLYVPGTAILIVLLLALNPGVEDAAKILLALNVGTLVGYALSWRVGGVVREHLPRLVGEAYIGKVRWLIDRYGALAMPVLALHPNNLSLAFALLGYAAAGRVLLFLGVAAIGQSAWWLLYASFASVITRQTLVDQSNFYLYLAALFAIWLAYELVQVFRTSR